MIDALHSRLTGLAMVAMLALAFVALGAGHRVASADEAAVEALALAGADVSALCGGSDVDGKLSKGDCAACHIAGGTLLSDPWGEVAAADLVVAAVVAPPRESRAPRAARDPAHGLRAPPTV
ncbi:hypothetical protein OEW28_07235 [Defluviimonas sp. WL0002]|uniref:Cytochrome c domain-containing protein n=1 Tax=Albidovulum marisflavi TaxID=2984159 RepID=A0ABT2ZBE2_9RHOB|nr:hypothetical protein [Defluviimonas sp. WL0002]MCV2868419.1 hypothetical protein [Defluviimonas sp. WL0002]